MKRAITLLVMFCTTTLVASAQAWEYRIEYLGDLEFRSGIEEIGQEGWELVSARRATSDDDYGYEMIFKRRTQAIDYEDLPITPATIGTIAATVGAVLALILLVAIANLLSHIRILQQKLLRESTRDGR